MQPASNDWLMSGAESLTRSSNSERPSRLQSFGWISWALLWNVSQVNFCLCPALSLSLPPKVLILRARPKKRPLGSSLSQNLFSGKSSQQVKELLSHYHTVSLWWNSAIRNTISLWGAQDPERLVRPLLSYAVQFSTWQLNELGEPRGVRHAQGTLEEKWKNWNYFQDKWKGENQ